MMDLIERLEKLTGPDREVDAQIAVAIGAFAEIHGVSRDWVSRGEHHAIVPPPHYTGSVDAKLPGEDIIGVSEQKQQMDHPPKWIAVHRMQNGRMSIAGRGATEPIARRIAALRARMADRSGA